MSFKYVDTRPRVSAQPVGFSNYKAGQCYKACVPPPQNGTHVNLHFNLTSHFQRLDTCKDPRAYSPAFKILFKQRARPRIFTGQAPTKCYPVGQLTRKLASYDPTRHPADSTSFPNALHFPPVVCNKPLYSKQEVQSIVDRLYQKKDAEGRCPPVVTLDKTRKTFPAEMVDKIVNVYGSTNRLCMKPSHRNRTRDQMYAQKTVQDQQKCDAEDVEFITSRLNQYDENKWPPNSKGYPTKQPGSPEPILYPPQEGSVSGKYVDDVVERLYHGRWKSPTYQDDNDSQDQEGDHGRGAGDRGEDYGYQSDDEASEKSEKGQEQA